MSRSALQNDGFVKKISDYITKKVSDKLTGMFKVDRENYEKYWDDISPFIKYGCLKDEKFGDKMKDAVIFKDLDGKYVTVDEYLKKDGDGAEEIKEEAEGGTAPAEPSKDEKETDRKKETIFYVTDEKEQGQYIRMFKNAGQNAVMMLYAIDTPFISWFEQKKDDLSFVRIDADLTESFKEETAENSNAEVRDKLVSLFRAVLNDEELDVKVESLKDASVASLMTMSEDGRRMQEMMKMYAAYGMGMGDMGKDAQTLVLNSNNELVKRLLTETDVKEPSELGRKITEQLYDMALLQRNGLSQERMAAFIARSQELMLKL